MSISNIGSRLANLAMRTKQALTDSNELFFRVVTAPSVSGDVRTPADSHRMAVEPPTDTPPPSATESETVILDTNSTDRQTSMEDVSLAVGVKDTATTATPSGEGYLRQIASSLFNLSNALSSADSTTEPSVKPSSSGEPKKAPPTSATPTVPLFVTRATRVSMSSVDARTRALVKKIVSAESNASKLLRIGDLSQHLVVYPMCRALAQQDGIIAELLRQKRHTSDLELQCQIRQCLSLVGYVTPPRGRGIRLLSIDGGGTRGTMGLEVLSALERECGGRPVHELFDMVIGVSTGAVIAALLAGFRLDVDTTMKIYNDLASRLFTQGRWSGVTGLIWSHSYYNTATWTEILKETIGEQPVIATARQAHSPKLAFLSCAVNTLKLEPFLFRNYNTPVGHESLYLGSTKYKVWESLQASSAAPGYFKEVKLDNFLHQDGGVLVNNPTAIGVHECRLLWPTERIQCVLSVGNGRSNPAHLFRPAVDADTAGGVPSSTSIQEKIIKIVDSATDTESVHTILHDLMQTGSYFRLNPYMSHTYTLDEADPERIEQMRTDARLYLRRNGPKLRMVADALLRVRPTHVRAADAIRHQALLKFNRRW